ncbi:MAG: MlaD family protein [Myxococcota bacterium]|nr:MlaD family protein [Myxococcota bacterium]
MNARTPLLVGLVIVAAVVALTFFLTQSSNGKLDKAKSYVLYGDFSDAAGIRWKTRVQVNGLDVGRIEGIEHVRDSDGRLLARVQLRIDKKYDVYENAFLRKVAESLLGDFRLDLDPGTPGHRKLEEGEVIPNVQSTSDLEAIQSELRQVATNVNRVTDSVAKVLAGPEGEGALRQILASVERSVIAVEQTTYAVRETVQSNQALVNQMIADVHRFTGTLSDVSGREGEIRQITGNLAQLTERLNTLAGKLAEGEEGGELTETVKNLRETTENLASATRKIDQGQGTVGRLVNDSELVDSVQETVDGANTLIGSLARLQTQVELRTEYIVPFNGNSQYVDSGVRTSLGLRLIPRPDKYYLIEAVSDVRGDQSRHQISREFRDGRTGELIRSETEDNADTNYRALKFSVQFAKRYYFSTLRFGIIENTGGVGANFHWFKDKLELRVDMFDFTRRVPDQVSELVNPRFRAFFLYQFYDHLFAQAGIDDPFNTDLRTWFLGAALRFTDEDLKSIIPFAPGP